MSIFHAQKKMLKEADGDSLRLEEVSSLGPVQLRDVAGTYVSINSLR